MTHAYKFPLFWGPDKKPLGHFKIESPQPLEDAVLSGVSSTTLDDLRNAWGEDVEIGEPSYKKTR